MRVVLRPTTPADFLALENRLPVYRCQCLTAVLDDEVLAIGGFVFALGHAWASMVWREGFHRYPVAVHRLGRAVMGKAEGWGIRRALATAQPDNPAAERWLIRLGFKPTDIAGERVFVWEAPVVER